ncbi:FAD dependent oxidoreductase [Mycena rosella]|uniref:FAD dependent oxidoreductase n=1 Tax=Mycena rosella TaxID=1033263 RepID=A0AAD7DIK6_MYCRO|nr:FAD dependent oxidoreductase [Mycena rosella]
MAHNRKTLIVGAGCFGLSTALELLKRGWTDVTLSTGPHSPAPDAASNDLNKVVRTSYSDPFYAKFAQDAIASWKNRDEWGDVYHESGVLILSSRGGSDFDYTQKSYLNDLEMGLRVVFPPAAHVGDFSDLAGYLTRDGGWVEAARGSPPCTAKSLGEERGQRTTGVRCSDGTVFDADLVVLATGSWTGSAFPGVPTGGLFQATGHCIAVVQLTEDEGERYRKTPIVVDWKSGFSIFPPNEHNLIKMSVHSAGYTHRSGANNNISTPRTIASDPETGLLIPREDVKELRERLREVYPELANKPFVATRLCWYCDSRDGDWVVGYHPQSDRSLVFATAGSGHAFKFLPVMGRLVADAIEDRLSPDLVAKFAVDRISDHPDGSRAGGGRVARELDVSQMCKPEDLQWPGVRKAML